MSIHEGFKHPIISKEILAAYNSLQCFKKECETLFTINLDINDIIKNLTPIIESDSSDNVEIVFTTAFEILFADLKENYIAKLREDWAKISGLPKAAATTEAGWRKALNIRYKKKIDSELILSLPGTPIANITHHILTALEINFEVVKKNLVKSFTLNTETMNFDEVVALLNKKGIKEAKDFAYLIISIESRKHINLVWHQANKLQRVFPQKSAAELLAYGWFGLRAALAKYDPTLGFAFSTYACTRITGAIRDGVRAESPIPKRLTTFARKVDAAEAYLTQELGHTPTLKEISAFLGDDSEKLTIMPRLGVQASIEEMLEYSSENGGFPEFLAENSDPAETVIESFTREALDKAMKLLPSEEEEAVRLLVIEGVNPSKARVLTGATSRQMRARKDKGLAMLKEYLGPWDPHINNG